MLSPSIVTIGCCAASGYDAAAASTKTIAENFLKPMSSSGVELRKPGAVPPSRVASAGQVSLTRGFDQWETQPHEDDVVCCWRNRASQRREAMMRGPMLFAAGLMVGAAIQ